MKSKSIMAVTALALILAVGWRYRDSEQLRTWLDQSGQRVPSFKFDNGTVRVTAPPPTAATGVRAPPAKGLRKCTKGAQVIYTDQTCPPGTLEQPVTQGFVNVVPGGTNDAAATARRSDSTGAKDERSLRDQAMDRIIGQ